MQSNLSNESLNASANVSANGSQPEDTDTPPDGVMSFLSQADYDKFAFVCNTVVSPCICLLGLIGNSLGLSVLFDDTKKKKLSIYTYLCCLTLVDSVYLFLGLVRIVPQIVKVFDEAMANYVDQHMKLGIIYLDMVFAFSSRAILIAMSLERLIALVRPFDVKYFFLAKYPSVVVAGCLLFNVLFLLPFPIYLEVNSFDAGNATEYFVQFREHADETMDKYMIAQTVVCYFFPAVTLLFTNITIPLTYSNIIKWRRSTLNVGPTGAFTQQKKLTMTVFYITLLYLLCSLPNIFSKVLAFTDEEYKFDGKHKVIFWFFIDISNLFEYINTANDSLIYILVSARYRSVFKYKYCRCCLRGSNYSDNEPEAGLSNMAAFSDSSLARY